MLKSDSPDCGPDSMGDEDMGSSATEQQVKRGQGRPRNKPGDEAVSITIRVHPRIIMMLELAAAKYSEEGRPISRPKLLEKLLRENLTENK